MTGRSVALFLVFCFLPTLGWAESPARPIGCWALSSNTINAVTDGGDGVLYGNSEFRDGALALDGESGFVLFDGRPSMSPTGSVSYCLWVNPAADGAPLMRLLGRFKVAGNARDYCVFLAQGRVWTFFGDDGSADLGHAILKTTLEPVLPAGEWKHFAVTWDATLDSTGVSVFVDGRAVLLADAQSADIHSLHASDDASLTLGAYDLAISEDGATGVTNTFHGAVSQLVLFDGVLDPEVIEDLYSLGRHGSLAEYFGLAGEPSRQPSSPLDALAAVTPPADSPTHAGEEPSAARGRSGVIYVDVARGDDAFDGAHPGVLDRASQQGPKRTIKAGLRAAEAGNTVQVSAGIYPEGVIRVPTGTRVVFEGHVQLH